MTNVKKIQINELKIKKAIDSGLPLIITTYTLPHEMELYMMEVLRYFLKELQQEHSFEYLSYCLSELITNAKKANTKRIYFKTKNLNLFDTKDYTEGMKTFKDDTLNNITYYLEEQKKEGLYIKLILQHRKTSILFQVRNNAPMTVTEFKRIHDKLSRAQQYTSMEEAFASILDTTEGAGLGLIILSLMLKKIGISSEDFIVDCTDTETVISINYPIYSKQEEKTLEEVSCKLIETIEDLPHFPENITKINNLLNDEDSKLSDIAKLISNDITLTADLLKLVNSAAFGVANPCNNILKAVQFLGTRGIKNLLYSIGAMKALEQISTQNNSTLWNHSYKVAFYSYNIARNFFASDRQIVEDSYVCGLLHDMGRVIFDNAYPNLISNFKKNNTDIALPVFVLEKLFDGINHTEIGAIIAKKWNLSDVIIESIKHHHKPTEATEEFKKITNVVYLANMIANYQDGSVDFYQFETSVLESLSITSEETLKSISDKLQEVFLQTNR